MTSVTGSLGQRAEPQNGRKDPPRTNTRRATPARPAAQAAAATRRRTDRRSPADARKASWAMRVAAIGLLALLMIALIVIVLSLL